VTTICPLLAPSLKKEYSYTSLLICAFMTGYTLNLSDAEITALSSSLKLFTTVLLSLPHHHTNILWGFQLQKFCYTFKLSDNSYNNKNTTLAFSFLFLLASFFQSCQKTLPLFTLLKNHQFIYIPNTSNPELHYIALEQNIAKYPAAVQSPTQPHFISNVRQYQEILHTFDINTKKWKW